MFSYILIKYLVPSGNIIIRKGSGGSPSSESEGISRSVVALAMCQVGCNTERDSCLLTVVQLLKASHSCDFWSSGHLSAEINLHCTPSNSAYVFSRGILMLSSLNCNVTVSYYIAGFLHSDSSCILAVNNIVVIWFSSSFMRFKRFFDGSVERHCRNTTYFYV